MATTYQSDTGRSEPIEGQPTLTLAGKIGAALFALWGTLHMWVGYEGTVLYFSSPAKEQWRFFAGGSNAPQSAFQLPTDAVTMHVHANFILNFCYDVFGYGLLGVLVSWLLFRRASWIAYLMGAILIGICDMSFMFLQVTSGNIALNVPTISGPVLWALAVLITPFGMPRWQGARELI